MVDGGQSAMWKRGASVEVANKWSLVKMLCEKMPRGVKVENDILILLPVTGKSGGKRKSTVVTMT